MKVKFILSLVLAASFAAAQTNNSAVELDTMVVTSSRTALPEYKVAGNVDVITSEDILANKYLNVVDAIKTLPGVYVKTMGGNAAGAEVSMRGFGENSGGRVLVLVDGQRLNNPDMAKLNWLSISMVDVEKIEVVHGGSSALYGDNAVAGVINIITKPLDDTFSTKLKADGGSYGLYNVSAAINGNMDKLFYNAFVNFYGLDGYRDNSDFTYYGAGAKLSYALSDALTVYAGAKYSDIEQGMPGSLTMEQIKEDRRQASTPDDRTKDEYLFADAGVALEMSPEQDLFVDFGYQMKDSSAEYVSFFSWTDSKENRYGVLPKYVGNFEVMGVENKLTVGSDIYFNDLTVDKYGDSDKTMKSIHAKLNKNTIAAYVHDEITIAESYIVYGAGRVENYEVKADVQDLNTPSSFDDSKNDTETAFDLGFVKTFEDKSKLFVKGSTLFRLPFLDEQVSYYGFGTDTFYQDIDPETGWDVDFGGDWNVSENLNVALTLYYMEMNDEIAYNAVTFQNENMEDTRHMGVEARFAYFIIKDIKLFGNYTFNDATFIKGDNKNNDIPLVPRHNLYVGAWFFLPAGFSFKAEANYISSAYLGGDYANTGDKLDEYVVVNALLNYACPVKRLESLSLYAAVDNIFDEEYSSVAYQGWSGNGYYPEPGTTFAFGLEYEF
jgi:iron complex outermembrane recepter protein